MIKLFLTDLDGCLTDGGYWRFTECDGIAKRFNVRDFHGMEILHNTGISVGIITRARSNITHSQISQIASYAVAFTSIQDKLKCVQENFAGIDIDDISYIGDDLPDIELLKEVGLAACPNDAEPQVIKIVQEHRNGIVLTRTGGNACVRELINIILGENNV